MLSSLKYLSVFSLPVLAYISFNSQGWTTYLPLIEAFVIIPLLELFFKPNADNITKEEESSRLNHKIYDLLVYSVVPVQLILLWVFLNSFQGANLDTFSIIGRITGMGMLCGVMGINVAHELGHRRKKSEQWMSKILLMTSLYMHFFIEHNRGHHRNVSTREDPSSARFGESLYGFWFRSVVFAYLSAWRLEAERLAKKNFSSYHLSNEMIHFHLIQGSLLASIYWFFGWQIMTYFIAAAVVGFLLLETVNYIEHYGLSRDLKGDIYERVMPWHSWNSDHIVGRIMLFELSRHSDHHYIASRKYQVLRHLDDSPQMPTGYPGMMLLAAVPPLWFFVMHDKISKLT